MIRAYQLQNKKHRHTIMNYTGIAYTHKCPGRSRRKRGSSPPLPNYDYQGIASGTCFSFGKLLSLTAFGGVYRTETTQRQKLTKIEKLRSDAYCTLALSRRKLLDLWLALLGIDSTSFTVQALTSTRRRPGLVISARLSGP
jgi:hypothetical protein